MKTTALTLALGILGAAAASAQTTTLTPMPSTAADAGTAASGATGAPMSGTDNGTAAAGTSSATTGTASTGAAAPSTGGMNTTQATGTQTTGTQPAGTQTTGTQATGTQAPGTMATGTTTATTMPAPAPQDFVNEAASGGMFEVKSSELALQRSKSDEVKAFAQMMIDDHTKANDELKTIATAKKLNVPAEPAGKAAEHLKAVTDASDADFDTVYLQHQAAAHADTIRLFAAMAGDKTDAELADFAGKTLPTLNKHAEHVVALVK